MNCANHTAIPASVYCRTCGKPLCDACKRDVTGVIYCEQCLADRLRDVHPNIPPVPPAPIRTTPVFVSGPHPAVAGILAGFFPFGVGAVYTGQYAKGLAHLLIFTGLIWGLSSGHMGGFEPVLGIGMGFFVVYQIIDAVRSANAIRLGQTPPDPFGFNRAFGMTDRSGTTVTSTTGIASSPVVETSATPTIPTAAVVLIGLGVLFLLQTAGVFEFNVSRIWPLFMIGLGVWLIITRSGMLGQGYDSRRVCSRRVWSGPIWLITIGGLFLIQSFDGPGFGRTWPVLLLVVGLMRLFDNKFSASIPGPPAPPPVSGYRPENPSPPENQASTEVKNG